METGEDFAVKVFELNNMNEYDKAMLENEMEILSKINHPNIHKLIEAYESKEEKRFYLVFELLKGHTLASTILEYQYLTEEKAASTLKPVVDSLRYMHSLGLAHRDLKPENLVHTSKGLD